jgi:bifunctional DNase/RNase
MKAEDRLIPVQIFDIYPYSDAQQGFGVPQNFLVLLKSEENKVVPINIGHFEGSSLAMAIRKIALARPLTHNLLHNLLEKFNAKVHKLVIHTLKDDVFHAYLLVQTQGQPFYLDCRPSDGMILAALMNVPIFVSLEVMTEAGRVLEVSAPEKGGPDLEVAFQPERPHGPAQKETGAPSVSAANGAELSELEQLKAHLNWLIAQEAYEQAAKVRDQIKRLERGN